MLIDNCAASGVAGKALYFIKQFAAIRLSKPAVLNGSDGGAWNEHAEVAMPCCWHPIGQ